MRLLGWAPRVPATQRAAFEAEARRLVLPAFAIHRTAAAGSAPTPEQADSIPFEYLEPTAGHDSEYGLDLTSGPDQEAVFRARDTGQMTPGGRIRLDPAKEEFGWTFFLPVYEPGPQPRTREERRNRFKGVVKGVFSVSDLVSANREASPPGAIELMLEDRAPGASEQYMISLSNGKWEFAPTAWADDLPAELRRDVAFPVGDREWRLHLRPSSAWLATQRTAYAYASLAAGLILTGLLVSMLAGTQRRARVIAGLVRRRTAQLRETQEELREDIRRRDAAEQALRASEERYRTFVTQSTEAIWCYEIDPPIPTDWPTGQQIDHFFRHGWMAECNDAMARHYGFSSANDIRGKPASQILPPWDPKKSAHFLAFIQNGYQLTDREMAAVDAKGDTRIFLTNVTGFVEDGLLIRAWGVHRDITERKRIERKLLDSQKLESLGVLAGGIAHDFNNLLTGILGNASLARMELPETSPAQPCLEQIEQASEKAADLCQQMLAYSGKGRFVIERLNLSAIVRSTADLIRLSINKSVVLKLSLANGQPAISGDATQIRQIIMNLVINASDAITERSGVINVTTGAVRADRTYLSQTYLAPSLPEGDYVFLEVSDNGCGMSPETVKRIFDPFFTTKFAGRGLGLAAVLGIIRGHQGALKVYSELGCGTTFKLLLPAAGLPEEEKARSTEPLPEWRGSGTILLVDDEETVRAVSERMLRKLGFDVLPASNGSEALDLFRRGESQFSAVMLDLTMPHPDGNATFAELRRINPHIRVLLMSGFNEQDATLRFAGQGLSGFIQKPFEASALRAKLHAMFEVASRS
jgi:PAS domain S-box-containing protein